MFMQNVIKLSAAVHEIVLTEKKNLTTMPKYYCFRYNWANTLTYLCALQLPRSKYSLSLDRV